MWKRLLDAYSKVVEITLPMQEYPDLNRMPPKEFEDFLAKSNLTAYHKEQLAKETDKRIDITRISIINTELLNHENSFTSFIHMFFGTIKYFLKHPFMINLERLIMYCHKQFRHMKKEKNMMIINK